MTDQDAIAWCIREHATVHFRLRSRTDREVTVSLPDDVSATAGTLESAIARIEAVRARLLQGPRVRMPRFVPFVDLDVPAIWRRQPGFVVEPPR